MVTAGWKNEFYRLKEGIFLLNPERTCGLHLLVRSDVRWCSEGRLDMTAGVMGSPPPRP